MPHPVSLLFFKKIEISVVEKSVNMVEISDCASSFFFSMSLLCLFSYCHRIQDRCNIGGRKRDLTVDIQREQLRRISLWARGEAMMENSKRSLIRDEEREDPCESRVEPAQGRAG